MIDLELAELNIAAFEQIERERGSVPSDQHPCSIARDLIAEVRSLRAGWHNCPGCRHSLDGNHRALPDDEYESHHPDYVVKCGAPGCACVNFSNPEASV